MAPSSPALGAGWRSSQRRDTALGSGGGTVGTGLAGFCCSWGCPCLSAQRPLSPGVTARAPMQVMAILCHGLSCRLKMAPAAGPRCCGAARMGCPYLLPPPCLWPGLCAAVCSCALSSPGFLLLVCYLCNHSPGGLLLKHTCSARISISITS